MDLGHRRGDVVYFFGKSNKVNLSHSKYEAKLIYHKHYQCLCV